MAECSVNYLSDLINDQIASREELNDCLSKAEALAQVVLSDAFCVYSQTTRYCTLWVLSDLVERARKLNVQAINNLVKQEQQSRFSQRES